MSKKDPSLLPGTHRTRVFLGGSYTWDQRSLLEELRSEVERAGFVPIIADEYHLEVGERDIHDVTLGLLHSCRLAIFDLTINSGALMEIERTIDYGTWSLVLYSRPPGSRWMASRMLQSFAMEHGPRISVRWYFRPSGARQRVREWLRIRRSMAYARSEV